MTRRVVSVRDTGAGRERSAPPWPARHDARGAVAARHRRGGGGGQHRRLHPVTPAQEDQEAEQDAY